MKCQICQQSAATIHVTEVREDPDVESCDHRRHHVEQQHLCRECAGSLELPFVAPAKKNLATAKHMAEIWKVIQVTAQKENALASLTCPDCGMSLTEFRAKGRLGCARCYEVFAAHIDPLLERIHNATSHRGRMPGVDTAALERTRKLDELKRHLDEAVRAEDYERAATLRDELRALELPDS
ncbi:MAG: UvrB/UvrC motif-containing protein [Planctomycetota bacterium]